MGLPSKVRAGLAVMVLATCALGVTTAAAQLPPGPPPSSAQSTTSLTQSSVAPDVQAALNQALVVTLRRAAVLEQLNAFSEPTPPVLPTILAAADSDPNESRDDLLAELHDLEQQGQDVLVTLGGMANLSPEVTQCLGPLPADQQAAIEAGQTAVVLPGPYLSALDDLVNRAGSATTRGNPVDPAPIIAAYHDATGEAGAATPPSSAGSTGAPTSSTTVVAASSASSSSSTGWLPVAIGALVLAALVGGSIALRHRRKVGTARFDELLEVSRALALARTRDDVERLAAEEAARLLGVTPPMAAVVRRAGAGLEMGYEVPSELLVPEQLSGGLLARVLETGQGINSVVTHEPALRSLPVSMVSAPVIGSGRVEAVILVVRSPDDPFTEDDLELLRKVGPIVAASLDSARHAEASAEASLTDPLTGVGNRRKLEVDLADMLADAEGPTSLAMVDLDHFKLVNDTHGHPAGDELLRQVAAALCNAVRPTDGVYRYGGEEFAVLLPATAEHEAAAIADRARRSLEGREIELAEGSLPAPTASLGVAATDGPDDLDPLRLIAQADRALYRAKETGRNRVVAATGLD